MGPNGPLGVSTSLVTPTLAEREALIVVSTAEGLGPATLARFLARLGSARNILAVAAGPGAIARLVGYPPGATGQLLEDHKRATRRARAAFERVFFG